MHKTTNNILYLLLFNSMLYWDLKLNKISKAWNTPIKNLVCVHKHAYVNSREYFTTE